MKNKLLMLGVLLSFILYFNANINAEYIDNETPTQERNEDEAVEEEFLPKTRARAALTIPTEGVYDTIKDTKNAAGVMTARSYYYKNKLVEKRTYTSTGSTDCRMKNKYLYFSNGSTVYIHRTYSNTKDVCYNLQTKRYNEKSQIQGHSIYEGKVNGKIVENRYYEATGTYYTQKAFYKNGIVTKRDYWKGAGPNRITHTANYNSAGTEWINATYNYYPNDTDRKEYITYTGTTPNKRKTATGYDEDGNKTYYITYNSNGSRHQVNNYDEAGFLTMERRYHADSDIYDWVIEYQEGNNRRDTITYRNTNNKIIKKLRYYSNGVNLKWQVEYHNGKKSLLTTYEENSNESRMLEYDEKINSNDYLYNSEYKNLKIDDLSNEDSIKSTILSTLSLSQDQSIYYEDLLSVNKLVIKSNYNSRIVEDNEDEEVIEFAFLNFFTELQYLQLNDIGLMEIPDSIEMMSKLEKIDLSENNIDTISTNFNRLTKIEDVNLSSNKISDISDCFEGLTNMKSLNLENNNIENISNSLFELQSNGNLEYIQVGKNDLKIKTIDTTDIDKILDGNLFLTKYGEKISMFNSSDIEKELNVGDENILLTSIFSDFVKEYCKYLKDNNIYDNTLLTIKDTATAKEILVIEEPNIFDEEQSFKIAEMLVKDNDYTIKIDIKGIINVQEEVSLKYLSKTLEEENNEIGVSADEYNELDVEDKEEIEKMTKDYEIETIDYYDDTSAKSRMIDKNDFEVIDGGISKEISIENGKRIKRVKTNIEVKDEWLIKKEIVGMYFYEKESLDFLFFVPNLMLNTGDSIESGNFIIIDGVVYVEFDSYNSNVSSIVTFKVCTDVINDKKTKWKKRGKKKRWSLMVKPTKCARAVPQKDSYNYKRIKNLLWPQTKNFVYKNKRSTKAHRKMFKANEPSLKKQLICHFEIPRGRKKSTWNIEPWRKEYSYSWTIFKGCNP